MVSNQSCECQLAARGVCVRVRVLWGLCVLLPVLVHAQGMQLRYVAVSATDVNTTTTFDTPLKALLVDNIGGSDAFINVSAAGVAAATGTQNVRVRANAQVTITTAPDERILLVGVICATGQTATVYLTGTR